jgi:hypothetical protein
MALRFQLSHGIDAAAIAIKASPIESSFAISDFVKLEFDPFR